MKHQYFLILLAMFSAVDHTLAQAPVTANVIQYAEPAEGRMTKLTHTLSIPEEDAGYTLITPKSTKPNSIVILFHSGRDTSNAGFEMRLYREAVKRNSACLYVTTGNRFEFLFDEGAFRKIDTLIHKAIVEADLPQERLLFAGMSLAGTRAMKFAIWCKVGKSAFGLSPKAVAVCDAPLDMVRFWKQLNRAKELAVNKTSAGEAVWVTAVLERNLGGTPYDNIEGYYEYSPFSYDLKDGGNAAVLIDTPFRAYTEPDVQWWMKNRGKDYYSMNALDAAAVVNQLNLLENTRAELILTEGKGFHPDGTRHPHSWSIVDNGELVEWLLGLE